MQSETPAPHVYAAIAEVAGKLAKDGISKNRNNAQQGYKFRGIDDVYNALAPVLSECALCILPNVLEREQVERQTKNGGVLIYTTVKVEFIFVSAKDGSQHAVSTYGEAMDSADKSTNKAMSAAYKYAAMMAFCIPTEGDNDADATTHEVAPRQQANGGPTTRQVMELAGKRGVEPQGIPGDLANAGILPSPLPSNQWSAAQVAAAVEFYRKEPVKRG